MKRLALTLLLAGAAWAQFATPPGVDGKAISPSSITTTGTITAALVKTDVLDAGVANVAGQFQANGAQLEAAVTGVSVRNDFTVTAGNDAIFSRHARVNGDFKMAGAITDSATAPTISTGGCTSPSITTANGTAYMEVTIGSSCTGVKTFTLAMPTVSTGYQCSVRNKTAARKDNLLRHSDGTTSTVIITNYGATAATPTDYTAGDVIAVACRGG